jgi:putative NADH-flavin reductase
VFGATGRTAKYFIPCALKYKHRIKAAARDPGKATSMYGDTVEVVECDVTNESQVADAICGCNAVVCFLSGPSGIPVIGIQNIIAGMKQHKVKRIMWQGDQMIKGRDMTNKVHESRHQPRYGCYKCAGCCSAKQRDNQDAFDLLFDSGLQWTVSRPGALVDEPAREGKVGGLVTMRQVPITRRLDPQGFPEPNLTFEDMAFISLQWALDPLYIHLCPMPETDARYKKFKTGYEDRAKASGAGPGHAKVAGMSR